MNRPVVEMLIAAAVDNVGGTPDSRPLSYATWNETRHDDEFEPVSAIRYLRSEGHDVDESVLHAYFDAHRQHEPSRLTGITDIAPWIDCLDAAFVDYQSFKPLREDPRYSEIFTFSTPALSDDGKLGLHVQCGTVHCVSRTHAAQPCEPSRAAGLRWFGF